MNTVSSIRCSARSVALHIETHSETQAECVFRHVQAALLGLHLPKQTYAAGVVEHYHKAVQPTARRLQFQIDGDPWRAQQTNAQRIFRYFEPGRVLPADLVESLLAALPEPYRTVCRRDLAARYGLLDVQIPDLSGSDMQSLGDVAHQFGEALQAMAPILEDSKIAPDDGEHLGLAAEQVRALISAAEGLMSRLVKAKEIYDGLR